MGRDFFFIAIHKVCKKSAIPPLDSYLVLDFEGPLLSKEDAGHGLIVLDGTWKLASKMKREIGALQGVETRRLPEGLSTAYPRRQEDCKEPERGLASIEALYAAYHILRWDTEGLLDHYYWKKQFLQKNSDIW